MKKKVTIAKRSASSKGTANIENKNCIYSSEPAQYEVIFAKAY